MTKEWKEVETKIFSFGEIGQSLEGRLIKKEKSKVYDNNVYHIQTKDKGTKVVFGTVILDDKLTGVSVNSEVRIVFDGYEKSKKAGQNDLKLFRVFRR